MGGIVQQALFVLWLISVIGLVTPRKINAVAFLEWFGRWASWRRRKSMLQLRTKYPRSPTSSAAELPHRLTLKWFFRLSPPRRNSLLNEGVPPEGVVDLIRGLAASTVLVRPQGTSSVLGLPELPF